METVGWLLLARTAALGFGYLPARQTDAALPPGLGWLQPVVRHGMTPAILAVTTVWLVVLMLAGSGAFGGGSAGPAPRRTSAPRATRRGRPGAASEAPAREARR